MRSTVLLLLVQDVLDCCYRNAKDLDDGLAVFARIPRVRLSDNSLFGAHAEPFGLYHVGCGDDEHDCTLS